MVAAIPSTARPLMDPLAHPPRRPRGSADPPPLAGPPPPYRRLAVPGRSAAPRRDGARRLSAAVQGHAPNRLRGPAARPPCRQIGPISHAGGSHFHLPPILRNRIPESEDRVGLRPK